MHSDAMETGDIPPPTLPHVALLFSRNADGPAAGPEETSSSSWVKDGQHLANLCSQRCFLSTGVSEATVWVLSAGNIPQSTPSHQDTSLNATCRLSSRCSSLLGHKILHASAREHIPEVQRTPTLHRDAKNPRQDYQSGCGTKMVLSGS